MVVLLIPNMAHVKERVLRIKNFWCIKALLKFQEFHARHPSKPEIEIVLDSFNAHFKALKLDAI